MCYHIIAFIAGFVLDLLIGDPHFIPHPVRLIGSLISFLDKRLNCDVKYNSSENETAAGVNTEKLNLTKEAILELQDYNELLKLEEKEIPEDIDYDKVKNLASEARSKLKQVHPRTIAQASRISGVNPVDISVLSIYLKKEYPHE